jgi:hypothetical protein
VAPSARGAWNLHFFHHHARTTASIAVLWTPSLDLLLSLHRLELEISRPTEYETRWTRLEEGRRNGAGCRTVGCRTVSTARAGRDRALSSKSGALRPTAGAPGPRRCATAPLSTGWSTALAFGPRALAPGARAGVQPRPLACAAVRTLIPALAPRCASATAARGYCYAGVAPAVFSGEYVSPRNGMLGGRTRDGGPD